MGCKKKAIPDGSNRNRETIKDMFERGHVKGAAWHRKQQCANGNECGKFCEWLSKDEGQVPQCIDPETHTMHSSNLYADYKRQGFTCPRGLF